MSSPGRRTFAPQSHQTQQQTQQHDHSYYQQLAAQQQQQAYYQQQQQYQHPDSIPMPSTSPSHQQASAPPSPSSRSPNKFSWGFGRSRRNSEVTSDSEGGNGKGNRSRKNSRSPSPNTASSFVVRSVTKQPGGVNASPNGSDSGSPAHAGMARRMTLEGDEVAGVGVGAGQYERQKSRPLSNALGVPLGGPGGGVGYGGKGSSNDGRPEGVLDGNRFNSNSSNPIQRPPSPGAITKKGFNQGMESKNKIQQASNQLQQQRSRSPSPSPSTHSGNRNSRQMIGAGPLSVREREARARDYAINGGRSAPDEGSWLSKSPNDRSSTSPLPSPSGPRSNPQGWNPPRGGAGAGAPGQIQNPNSRFSTSPSTAAITNTNAYANYSPSNPPPESALHGLPSPVPIPSSRDRSNSRPHTPGGTSPRTPFGSVSPGGSPSLANRLIKGIFGARSPKPGDGEIDGQQVYEGGAMGGAPGSQWKSPEAWSNGSPLPGGRSPLANSRSGLQVEDEVEREAQLRKRSSQRQAARIVDEERRKAFETPSQSRTNGFDPATDKPWSPRQAINSDDEDAGANEFPSRNPNPNAKKGRKPVPNLNEVNHEKLPSEHDLKLMDEDQRRKVARDVDPGDALSRLEGRLELTPAQRIIQETRSKHLAEEERLENARRAQLARQQQQQQQQQKGPTVQRGFDTNRAARGSEVSAGRPPTLPDKAGEVEGKGKGRAIDQNQEEVPVRRGSKTSPVKQTSAPQNGPPQAGSSQAQAPSNAGLVPGTGPMPTQMPLNAALQEMVVRFYRFERYAVPLIRSLETRLLDIERDAQMAQLQGDALSVNSNRDREMDKWVGQMTGVMKHEVGQLKAATKEIREGRELVAEVARMQNRNRGREPSSSMAGGGSQFLNRQVSNQTPSAPALRNNPDLGDSPSSTRVETGAPIQHQQQPPLQKLQTSNLSQNAQRPQPQDDATSIPPSESEQSTALSQQESAIESEGVDSNPATTGHAHRTTNISSASFASAVPASRTETLNRNRSRAQQQADSPSVSALERKKTLDLPPGSAPALDKDEGKYSPKKHSQELDSDELPQRERERSVSPSGRKRYTSTLGEPMRDGRISPSGDSQGQGSRISNFSRREVLSPPSSNRFDSVGSDPRKGANMSSPSHSDAGSATSTSTAGRRDVSNRLKALMAGTSPKTSTSLLSGGSVASASSSMIEQEKAEEDEAENSVSSRIGDDYSMVSSPLEDDRATRHQAQPSTSTNTTVTPARAAAAVASSNDRLQAPPSPSGYSSHLKTPSGASANSGRTLSNASNVGTATPLIGGRVSPTPSRRSTSPSNFVPVTGGSNITTSSHASQGLRARAQSYLQKAEEPEASSPGGGSAFTTNSRRSTLLDSPQTSTSPPKLSSSPTRKDSTSPFDSANPTPALNLKKSANSVKSNLTGGSAFGSSSISTSTSNLNSSSPRKGPPPGASLKERVAFFDTQK